MDLPSIHHEYPAQDGVPADGGGHAPGLAYWRNGIAESGLGAAS